MVQPASALPPSTGGAYGNVVELRVHGVSGTPPEELLDRQLVRQVAGDKTAGFYRPRLREEWRDRPSNDPGSYDQPYSVAEQSLPPPLLEGYSWGGLTSGSPSRALWLILLPFTLVNVAPRMRPVPGAGPEQHRRAGWLVWYLCRVMAVSVTVTMTLGGVGIGLGIFAWQCPDQCGELSWPLSAMFVGTSPGWRILWGTALPLLLLAVLALLSWRNSVQYDLIRPIAMSAPVTAASEVGSATEPRLADPSFWYGRYPVARLRHLHLQAGVSIIGVALVLAAPPSVARSAGLALSAVIGVLLLVALAWPGLLRRADVPGDDADGIPSRAARYRNTGWILLIWVPAAAILLLGLLVPHGSAGRLAGEMGGYDELITVWFCGQSVLALVMIGLIAIMARGEPPRTPRRSMAGMGTAVMTVLGMYLGAALTSGLVILTAAWVSASTPWISIGDVQTVLARDTVIVPASMSFAGLWTFVIAVVVVAVVLIALVYVALMWARAGTAADRAAAGAAAQRAKVEHPRRFRRQRARTIRGRTTSIARSYWLARRADYLPDFLAVLVLSIGTTMSVLTLLYGFGVGLSPEVTGNAPLPLPSVLGLGTADAVAVGAWLIGVFAIALVVLGALAFRVPRTRKAVGILWDIGAFWPRDVHPLAPPCYAERAVPDIAMRLTAHAALVTGTDLLPSARAVQSAPPSPSAEGVGGFPVGVRARMDERADERQDAAVTAPLPGLVVLAGHSQGTVLSVAALLGPGRAAAGRTALLTFGTVLRRLYARIFPLYFSQNAFDALAHQLGAPPGATVNGAGPVDADTDESPLRWRNLWRRTDYLGGRIVDPLDPTVPAVRSVAAGDTSLDVELVDPLFLPVPGDTTLPPAGRHSNFTRDPAFQEELMALVRRAFRSLDRGATGPVEGAPGGPPGATPIGPPLDPSVGDGLMNPRESMI
jgi:hypothetical protein